MNNNGRITVLHVVNSYENDALRIILKININLNLEISIDLFRSSSFIIISFNDLVRMISLFFKIDVKIDIYNIKNRITLLTIISK